MIRRPSSPVLLVVGTVLTLLFIWRWAYIPSGLHVGASRQTRFSRVHTQDIYNRTLGFEKIFVVSLPSRTDRRDGMSLVAALSDIDFEFIDGVDGASIPDKALPEYSAIGRLDNPSIGAWRGHLNAIQEIVRRNLSSALILEDNADWDVRLRDQLHNFALSSHALTQPLADAISSIYADFTYPRNPETTLTSTPDLAFENLPVTILPQSSPYGDEWDVLWLGHCGMHFPFTSGQTIPKGRVVQTDKTVPQQQHLWTVSDTNDLKYQYPNHTRVTHHAQDGICSLGYAINRRSARQLLYEAGLKRVTAAFDIMLRWFCEGTGTPNRGYHNCLTTQPSLFQIHLPEGPKKHNSDISDHGEGHQEKKTEVIRWSVKMNAEVLINEGTDFVDQYPDVD
ncbi:hypothetical protein F5B22DRAFT_606489 [Xylaria bambusicola]|uniref:uncharacterized protein n=1 Tax=Xylaria bambusicola TaxID=326684 RepID=UPI002007D3D2|nr:uncharacterized protein F5B22DRAFT_606489 [Xylaria bambusicola]KAI0516784.1 hypothetical protein F5B22DRAFT_606489 [Xylaria bambusicola]